MKRQEAVNQPGGAKWRSHRRLRGLFLAGGLMAAMVGGPAVAKPWDDFKRSTPVKKTGCARGPRQTKYISEKVKDHSYVRVTWQPRFCAQDNEWVTGNAPVVAQTGAGQASKIILELEAPRILPDGIEYTGAVRKCKSVSVSGGLGGASVGTTVDGCSTMGKVTMQARVNEKKSVYYSWQMDKQAGGSKLIWTNKVI